MMWLDILHYDFGWVELGLLVIFFSMFYLHLVYFFYDPSIC